MPLYLYPSTGAAAAITEVEIDFGSSPVRSKSFTVTDAGVSPSSTVVAWSSAGAATGRGVDDALWDGITYACTPGTGSFTVHAHATGMVAGPRTILYQIA